MMQPPEPEREHLWLKQLIGEWAVESECNLGPDRPPMKSNRREVVRSLGSLWTIGEGSESTPESECDSVMTLGFDTRTKRFVGTFISSMMTHLWPYSGVLDSTGRILTLDSEGPSFAADGKMARYQDVIELVSDDLRILSSRVLGDDGQWNHFMRANYRRVQ